MNKPPIRRAPLPALLRPHCCVRFCRRFITRTGMLANRLASMLAFRMWRGVVKTSLRLPGALPLLHLLCHQPLKQQARFHELLAAQGAPDVQVHERTLQGDFLMALLRDIVAARRSAGNPLKVWLCCTRASALGRLGNHCRRLPMKHFWAMARLLYALETLTMHEWYWLVMDA